MATEPNEFWAMYFMSDQIFDDCKIRVLTNVDICTKVCPAIGVGQAYKGHDVVATLEAAAHAHGRPKWQRVDNGPEFVSGDLELWAWQHGVVLDYSRPGKPTDNAFAEAFNSRVRQACPNAFWFLSLEDDRCKIEAWRVEYNTIRPHSAIGHVPPADHAKSLTAARCGQ